LDGFYVVLPFTTAALHQPHQKLYHQLNEQINLLGARKIDESVFINKLSVPANTHAQTHKGATNKFKESGGFL
jgi:hypothetical protein